MLSAGTDNREHLTCVNQVGKEGQYKVSFFIGDTKDSRGQKVFLN